MRSIPALLVAALMATIGSIVLGFLIASWAFSGVGMGAGAIPATPPNAARATAIDAADDSWRANGYERIGLWDHEEVAPR